ncbi:Conserved_hypothetical protein [Hexamita inflata]|uniref:Uncharacterized protein n=1 Tax=Hexamita inflata TaxID=28002 RepID=A0AA86U8Z8_9EUKA|nr:Conserved hypothetical protein [Hexamita inflata]
MNVNSFALFGLNVNSQFIKDSVLNVTLQFQVFVGALVCIVCDVQVYNATLVFIAFGQQASAMVIEVQSIVQIELTFVQYRIQSQNSSGLVNVINQQLTIFSISDCKLSGSNLVQSETNGYIVSKTVQNITIVISHFSVCVDSTSRIGKFSASINVIGLESMRCDICTHHYVVYGICADQLQYAELLNGRVLCVYPFEFVDETCTCVSGYLLNGSKCINVVSAITNMQNSLNNDQIKKIEQDISLIQSEIYTLDQNIANNVSNIINAVGVDLQALEQNILSNFSEAESHISANMSLFDGRISGNVSAIYNVLNSNISDLENYIKSNYTKADINLQLNTTILDYMIYNNITTLNQSILNNFSILDYFQKQQDSQLQELQKYINCINILGFQMINNVCTQVSCQISGQQSINGVCQCITMFSIVQNNLCICPANSLVINNICTCNITAGLIMQNNVCICSTVNALFINGTCMCGIDAVNISNTCACPAYSTLVNYACMCNVIQGQIMVAGICQCPLGYSVVNNSCRLTTVIILNSDNTAMCSQVIFVNTFDIQIVSYTIVSANFSGGYVFNTATVIQSAFVDVSDNVYSTVKPLFQSQASFTNLKIQVGSQSAAGGSFLSNSDTIVINQLNIISRAGSQITASSGQVNILVTSSTNANVSNLLVDLSFTISQGGIVLINNIAGVFIINNYQILGSYQSQSCVSLIGKIASQSTITITNLNFMPVIFNVGNCSSYLFSQVTFTSIQINNTAIILGNKSNSQISNAIITNSSFSYQFSGIISQTYNTILLISKLISDCNQQFSQYIQKSGQLIGIAQQYVNNITIVNICLLQYISTQQYRQSGLIGCQEGNISIQQMTIQYVVNGLLTSIGLIGAQLSGCKQSEISNVIIIFNSIVDLASYGQVSAIVGASSSTSQLNFSIINVIVLNSTLESQYYIGAFIGYYSSNTYSVLLQNSTIQFSNITGYKQMAGGLIGNSYNASLIIDNIILQSLRIFAPSKCGIIIGFDNGNTFNIQYSVSIGNNYINNVIVQNCASLSNTSIPKGC